MNLNLLLSLILSVFIINSCSAEPGETKVICGAERTDLYLPLLNNARVGIVANHTSVLGGRHLVDTLLAMDVNLLRIFSPEHGFRGDAAAGEYVDNTIDSSTGLPVVSLYGSRRKPLPEDMEGLDVIIFDIQDVGARFYTYISTLQYVMERAAEEGVKLMVLDRPNPNGHYVDGPVLDTGFTSFVGMQPVPVVYGMTVGEYSMMINSEGWLDGGVKCDLMVVECINYTHNTEYILPVAPSPNLPNQNAVYLYPSLCFFEGTVFSCGRGTGFPFQIYGHPDYPVSEFTFTPLPSGGAPEPRLESEQCFGVDLSDAIEKGIVPGAKLNLEWLIDAYNKFPEKDEFFNSYFNTIAGNNKLKQKIIDGMSAEEISQSWQKDLDSFKQIRSKYLIYR